MIETADYSGTDYVKCRSCKECDFKLQFTPTLVRGQSYYTGTIFEVTMDDFEVLVAEADVVISDDRQALQGQDTPACGFSIGFERNCHAASEKWI